MIKKLDISELNDRILLNFNRLADGKYYQIGEVFSPMNYSWYGDKEGRALLAFVSHFKISGRLIPCAESMLAKMGSRFNKDGYFGPIYKEVIHEQQLSGHSWLLRGLCEHYEVFRDAFSLQAIRTIAENLYLPRRGKFESYPVNRDKKDEGDVSGSDTETVNGWCLSSDIGCAFMSIDGLSHAYAITEDTRIKALLDEMIKREEQFEKKWKEFL